MKSTVTKSPTILPGFDNVVAEQDGPCLYLLIEGQSAVHMINRNEYDCDPSFIYDVNRWAERHGGVKVAP